ncbi:MAG: transcription termination/antitermination protein NusA [Chlamydiae bacterium]|jgi:N utilization substance protein A|nr:transcription termination/antitermination protein NusA [Chlamydiota bacterium]
MNKDLLAIFEYLEREKGIKRDTIVKAIEEALLVAARKGQQGMNNVQITINPKTAEISAIAEKEIVEKVEYPAEEISLDAAREMDPNCRVGDWIDIEVSIVEFGRIAAQVARQLISQKIRNAERDVIYQEYRGRIGELISGTVSRVGKQHTLVVNLGKVEAVLPGRFYPKTEKYHIGDKVLALLYDVQDTENGGAEVILSRSHPEFVSALFMQEVPELNDGIVVINKVVRDAGFRTKMAVSSSDSKIDPVGACVGVRGSRVKNVIREVNNEKIDVIPYSDDPFILLKNAFSPVEIRKADYDEEQNIITLIINDEDYPAILGKKGTNVRLTSDLIGVKVEVHKMSEHQKELTYMRRQLALSDDPALDESIHKIEQINQLVVDSIIAAGFDTPRKLLQVSPQELAKLTDISLQMADDLLELVRKGILSNKT